MRQIKYWLVFVGMIVGTVSVWAQNQPIGRFMEDTVVIGKPFQYALSFRHALTQDVLFPDTARHFAPFMVRDITVFPTKTEQGNSRDSAVYTLVTFETQAVQPLQVPILIVGEADCTALFSQPDTVFLHSSLQTTRPDTLALATETSIRPLPQQFNYPALGLVLASMLIIGGAVYLLFGKSIRRQWELYMLHQRHLRFLQEYNRLIRSINATTATENANRAIVHWKLYLENLQGDPFTSMTTREIVERITGTQSARTTLNPRQLGDALKHTDGMIYGGVFSPQSAPALRLLRDVATQTYHRRRAIIQNR